MTDLKTSYPNVGDATIEYVHCPNCSYMYAARDDRGRPNTLPRECKRCDCPLDDGADEWMERRAEAEHNPALAALRGG